MDVRVPAGPDGCSLLKRYPAEGYAVIVFLMISSLLFMVGIFVPMLTLHKLIVFSNEVSLVSALIELFAQNEWLLFILIAIFCIVFPVLKHLMLYLIWCSDLTHRARHETLINVMLRFGKWSMLDVFVVAVLLVSVKLTAIASVEIHYAVYAFGASVLITLIMTEWTMHAVRRSV